MNLAQALRLLPPASLPSASLESTPIFEAVALVGSGGKTTALFQLARQLPPPVILSASAHLHVDQIPLADSHWIANSPADLRELESRLQGVVLVSGPVEGTRTTGLDAPSMEWLRAVCERRGLPLLIEADGSRQRPLKAPGSDEPPIPEFVQTVVVTAGLSGLGQPLGEAFVHRPRAFARLSRLHPGDPITPQVLARVLAHPRGGLKNIPPQARRLALLNQADTPELQAQAKTLAEQLLPAYQAVIIASLDPQASILDPQASILDRQSSIPHLQSRIHAVHEPVAGIVLAAGESRRMGQPKQLLDYHGQPFVRAAAATALAAGLSPVIVVTGANAEAVEAAVRDLPARIIRNRDWPKGQGSSIRAGLADLTQPPPSLRDTSPKSFGYGGGREGAAIFLLADQPQVTTAVLRALVERHSQDLAPVVAPLVRGQRANPVLFDRLTFPALLKLSGDLGGRALFSQYPPAYLPWHDESLLVDADRPEDLEKLRDW